MILSTSRRIPTLLRGAEDAPQEASRLSLRVCLQSS